jgi:hypothetical protein
MIVPLVGKADITYVVVCQHVYRIRVLLVPPFQLAPHYLSVSPDEKGGGANVLMLPFLQVYTNKVSVISLVV